jgi:hypothetical protein
VFSAPRYQWVERRHPLQWLSDLWTTFLDWVDRLNAGHPTLSWLMFGVAIVLLALLLTHIAYTVWRVYSITTRSADLVAHPAAGLELLDSRSHRTRAEALARAGRYQEALAHRFAALICDLGEAKAVTMHPSKTPAEYAREARLDDTGHGTLTALVGTLYVHLFGGEPIDEQGYRDFVNTAELVLPRVAAR